MEDHDWIVIPVVLFAVSFVLVGGMSCVGQRVAYVSALAEIEQLRKDLGTVTAQRSEDAVGQATQWNQSIAKAQAWNRVPFVNLWIPDGWDKIKAIEIPE